MFSRLLFGFILLTVNFVSVANTKEQAGDTIPFIIYKVKPINPLSVISTQTVNPQVYLSAQQPMIPTNFEVVAEATPVPVNEITNTIENVRKAVCRQAGNADIRIWFSADASGKILGVGAGAQSGLEVTFHCK